MRLYRRENDRHCSHPIVRFRSGLDTVSSTYCLQLLRGLAHQNRTIVCTIHQPSASMFQLFDHVYVLSQGYCVYQGSTDQLVPFLSTVGLHCPLTYNPADYVIEATDGEEPDNITKLAAATANGKLLLYKTKGNANNNYYLNEETTDGKRALRVDSGREAIELLGYEGLREALSGDRFIIVDGKSSRLGRFAWYSDTPLF